MRISDWSSDVCSSDLAMLSAVIPLNSMMNMKANMLADGLFHAFMWMATLIGVTLLWRALNGRRDASAAGWRLIGYMLAGWGWFNLVEGLIDHHLLDLHHVVEALGLSMWDWLFLASGIVLILVGHVIARKSKIGRASCRERGCQYG